LRTENGLDRALSVLWKRKSRLQNSDRIPVDCTETLQLPGGSLSYLHQQVRKAKRKKMPNFRH
jgi:hypothetical protein